MAPKAGRIIKLSAVHKPEEPERVIRDFGF